MSKKSLFSSFIDRLIHPSLLENELLATKSRMVIGLLSINTPGLIIAAIVILTLENPAPFYHVALIYIVTLAIGLTFSLFIIWYWGKYVIAASTALTFLTFAIFGSIYSTGGPPTSSFNVFLLFIPFFSFLFIGRRIGLITIFTVLVFEFSLVTLSFLGFQFPNIPLPYSKASIDFVCWFLSFFVVCEVIYFYERNSTRLQKELSEEKNLFEHMACHDPLTDIDNRVLFNEKLEKAIFRAERNKSQLAVLYIDLDGFKPINDNFGHDAGDTVLVSIANRLSKNIRVIDSVARIGGDEFAILMEDIKNLNDVKIMAKKISLLIAEETPFNRHRLRVFSSIGISRYPHDATEPDELTKVADLAMYKAKEAKPMNEKPGEHYTGQAFFANKNELVSYHQND